MVIDKAAVMPAGDAPGQRPAPSVTARSAAPRDDVVVLLLSDIAPGARAWAWWQVARGGAALAGTPGLVFAKVMGSGFEGGFGLRPSPSRQGLLAVFEGETAASDFLTHGQRALELRERSREHLSLLLRASSSRGSWGGETIHATVAAGATAVGGGLAGQVSGSAHTLVAALTRASIRPSKAAAFWRRSPAAERDLHEAPGCELAMGLGEAPLLRQCTFSLWRNQAAMDAYARSGAHLQAIRAAASGHFFSESQFVRLVPLSIQGTWHGRRFG